MNTVVIKFSYYDNRFQYFKILKQGSYKKNVSDFLFYSFYFLSRKSPNFRENLPLYVSPNYFIPRSLL